MTATTTELECEVCGALVNADGTPWPNQSALNRHISAKHPDEWEELREKLAKTPKQQPKKPDRPSKKERHDLSGGIQANVAVLALAVGFRSPWKGEVLTGFAPELGRTANNSAQAGPDWYYQAWEMASTGGAHTELLVTVAAIVICFRAERDVRMREYLPPLRAMSIPVPKAPWEDGSVTVPPPRPSAGPVVVDVAPSPTAGPADPGEGEEVPPARAAAPSGFLAGGLATLGNGAGIADMIANLSDEERAELEKAASALLEGQ